MADPSESSYPFSTSPILSEEEWARLERMRGTVDAVLFPSGLPTDGALKVTANGTSTVTIAAGEAIVGGFKYRNSTAITRSVPSNATGSTARVDHVVIEMSQSANSGTVRYITGGSSVPALTQSVSGVWQMRLAQVTVRAGASGAQLVDTLDRRVGMGPQPLMAPDDVTPAVAVTGQLLVRPDAIYIRSVNGWVQMYPQPRPVWTAVLAAGQGGTTGTFAGGFTNRGGGYFNCAYTLVDNRVTLRGWFKATQTKGAGSTLFILPGGYRPSQQQSYFCVNAGRVDVAEDGRIIVAEAMATNDTASIDHISFYIG